MTPRTEQELLDQTIALAMLRKWAVCHVRAGRTADGWRTPIQGHKGLPDLILARDGLVLFRELKGPKGDLSSEQRDWGRQIDPAWGTPAMAGGSHRMHSAFDVWRPADWDTIVVPTLTAPRTSRRTA